MFTFDAMPVKFIGLLVLFAWCTVWCTYELVQRQTGKQRVSNAWHLGMAVVMLLMVAGPTWKGLTSVVPTPVLAGIFGVGVLWYVYLAVDALRLGDRRSSLHHAAHGTMFAAMAWHLVGMAVKAGLRSQAMAGGSMASPMGATTPGGATMGAAPAAGHGGHMAMPPAVMEAMAQASLTGGSLWWVALVGVPLMAYLLVASVLAIRQMLRPAAADAAAVASCHVVRPVGSRGFRAAAASDFAMNGGMFWMSTGLMLPLLPWFTVLSF